MLSICEARLMVRVPSLLLLAAISMIPSVILRSSDNPEVQIWSRAKTPPRSNSPLTNTPPKIADPFQLSLNPYGRNNPPNAVEPKGTAIDIDDLRDKDKILWLKVVDLANTQDDDGNYVNPVLHVTYAALASGSRVFKIENNPILGPGTAGQFTITKFNGSNDFFEARIDLNFRTIKQINSTTAGDYDPSFQKYSGLLGRNGFILRLAETFGHEANHGIFGQRNPAQGTTIQKLLDDRDAAIRALPVKGRYPLSPDVLRKVRAADEALEPSERFAQAAERVINEELQASKARSSQRPHRRPNLAQATKSGAFLDSLSKTRPWGRGCEQGGE
jgi:hypothetical protein